MQLPLPLPCYRDDDLLRIEKLYGERLDRLDDGRLCKNEEKDKWKVCTIYPARTFEEYVEFRVGVLNTLIKVLMPERKTTLYPRWDKIWEKVGGKPKRDTGSSGESDETAEE